MPSKKITPCLWIDDRIEEMVNFYVATFKDAEIRSTSRYPDGAENWVKASMATPGAANASSAIQNEVAGE